MMYFINIINTIVYSFIYKQEETPFTRSPTRNNMELGNVTSQLSLRSSRIKCTPPQTKTHSLVEIVLPRTKTHSLVERILPQTKTHSLVERISFNTIVWRKSIDE